MEQQTTNLKTQNSSLHKDIEWTSQKTVTITKETKKAFSHQWKVHLVAAFDYT